MFHTIFRPIGFLFNVSANSSFKLSATSPNWRGFLTWQVILRIQLARAPHAGSFRRVLGELLFLVDHLDVQ